MSGGKFENLFPIINDQDKALLYRGGLEGATTPSSEHASPPSESKGYFFRDFWHL